MPIKNNEKGPKKNMNFKSKKSSISKEKSKKLNQSKSMEAITLKSIVEWFKIKGRLATAIVIAFVAVGIIIAIFVNNHNKKAEQEAVVESIVLNETVADSEVSTVVDENAEIPVPEEPLAVDAYQVVNDLVARYYQALEIGDVDAVVAMKSYVKETEKIRIQTNCQYIESYQNLKCYTKVGPEPNSYMVYVYYEAKLKGIDTLAPGMNPLYLCTNEEGQLYIYDGELKDNQIAYLDAITAQEDVVDLFTKVSVLYADAVASDENLKLLMASLKSELDTTVGETIAALEAEENPTTETPVEEPVAVVTPTEETPVVITDLVKATTTVNVRSSDSETADKIGKVSTGTELTRMEEKPNGWSKILLDGQEGFIKTEFLVSVTTVEGEAVIGIVTAKDNVNIRSSASETGDKLGVAYKGEELNLVEKQADGWCRINYKGQTAYVKTEFVQE